MPIENYRYSLYLKNKYKNGSKHWFPRNAKVEKYVLDRLKSEGPLQSKDFESGQTKIYGWSGWKPAKMALTNLFMDGTIMIAKRNGFQKAFDIAEHVLPTSINTTCPTEKEYCRYLVNNAINAHGLVALDEIAYLRKGIKPALKKVINEMLENAEIISGKVEGLGNTYYSNNQIFNELNSPRKKVRELHILNPFDNLLIQRKRVLELFNFDYQIECYVPGKKRVFGYYTLPVLYRDKFIARFDAKANRKTGEFTIIGFWYEKGYKPTKKFHQRMLKKLTEYAKFCGCDSVIHAPASSLKTFESVYKKQTN